MYIYFISSYVFKLLCTRLGLFQLSAFICLNEYYVLLCYQYLLPPKQLHYCSAVAERFQGLGFHRIDEMQEIGDLKNACVSYNHDQCCILWPGCRGGSARETGNSIVEFRQQLSYARVYIYIYFFTCV